MPGDNLEVDWFMELFDSWLMLDNWLNQQTLNMLTSATKMLADVVRNMAPMNLWSWFLAIMAFLAIDFRTTKTPVEFKRARVGQVQGQIGYLNSALQMGAEKWRKSGAEPQQQEQQKEPSVVANSCR